METNELREKLNVLVAGIVTHGIKKLSRLAQDSGCGLFVKDCELVHLEEQSKLAHRIDALLKLLPQLPPQLPPQP